LIKLYKSTASLNSYNLLEYVLRAWVYHEQ
jgi:hypothetical protein